MDDVNTIRPEDAFDKDCVVVATMQALRVDDKNTLKRKVYGHNENFERHFARLANVMSGLVPAGCHSAGQAAFNPLGF